MGKKRDTHPWKLNLIFALFFLSVFALFLPITTRLEAFLALSDSIYSIIIFSSLALPCNDRLPIFSWLSFCYYSFNVDNLCFPRNAMPSSV